MPFAAISRVFTKPELATERFDTTGAFTDRDPVRDDTLVQTQQTHFGAGHVSTIGKWIKTTPTQGIPGA